MDKWFGDFGHAFSYVWLKILMQFQCNKSCTWLLVPNPSDVPSCASGRQLYFYTLFDIFHKHAFHCHVHWLRVISNHSSHYTLFHKIHNDKLFVVHGPLCYGSWYFCTFFHKYHKIAWNHASYTRMSLEPLFTNKWFTASDFTFFMFAIVNICDMFFHQRFGGELFWTYFTGKPFVIMAFHMLMQSILSFYVPVTNFTSVRLCFCRVNYVSVSPQITLG